MNGIHYSFYSCMTETSVTSDGLVYAVDLFPFHMTVAGYDHLADAFAIVDYERLVRQIDYYYAYLATIICVNRPG